ncbi:MAG: hypothetical protein JWM80_3326 [Cyanobacteria bacterium RYN_339]|nr:hypothetical protein [Cyanobacteria bacterium RYN_339]
MLSRTAESFFWIGRYIERAEYTARMCNAHLNLLLEHPDPNYAADLWARIMAQGGDLHLYRERHGTVDQRQALEFLALDPGNPNGIISCVAAARENARHVQDQLSSEVWSLINGFFLRMQGLSRQEFWGRTHAVLQEVLTTGYAFHGVVSNTMLHDERLAFYRLGRDLERAGRTVRLLKSPALLDMSAEPAGIAEFQECVAVLKSASAYEAYRKTYRSGPDPAKIVDFLLLSENFPRSVRFCARTMARMLPLISGGGQTMPEPERLVGQFQADTEFASLADIYDEGLEAYLDALGDRLDVLADAFGRAYFRYDDAPGVPSASLPQRRKPFPRLELPTSLVQAVVEVRHDFTYTYDLPVGNVRTILRLVPNQRYGRQRLLDCQWHMEPKGAFRQSVDAFGNQVWQIDHERVERQITCTVSMRVENHAVYHAEGALGLRGVLLSDEDLGPGMAGPSDYATFTPLVDTSEALLVTAQRLKEEQPQSAHLAEAVMREVHQRMRFESGVTDVATTASEAFTQGSGVCQDYTHVMLSICRLAGLPARYVSGYLPAEGMMHAWAEVLVSDPATGRDLWVAYDPTHNRRADETYVTVGIGREYQDVAPTSGFYTGMAANHLGVMVTARLESRRPISRGAGTAPLGLPSLGSASGQEAQQQQ